MAQLYKMAQSTVYSTITLCCTSLSGQQPLHSLWRVSAFSALNHSQSSLFLSVCHSFLLTCAVIFLTCPINSSSLSLLFTLLFLHIPTSFFDFIPPSFSCSLFFSLSFPQTYESRDPQGSRVILITLRGPHGVHIHTSTVNPSSVQEALSGSKCLQGAEIREIPRAHSAFTQPAAWLIAV